MRLEELSPKAVRFSAVNPIEPGPAWARNGIHTLNRAGEVEVVDSAVSLSMLRTRHLPRNML
jgi:hypothetical protein